MEPGAVSRPPLATRPPTQPTQILTRTRTALLAAGRPVDPELISRQSAVPTTGIQGFPVLNRIIASRLNGTLGPRLAQEPAALHLRSRPRRQTQLQARQLFNYRSFASREGTCSMLRTNHFNSALPWVNPYLNDSVLAVLATFASNVRGRIVRRDHVKVN